MTCCSHTILGWIKLLASCTHAISPQYLLRLNVFCLNISHTHCKSKLMMGQTCSKHGDFAGWHSSGLYCSRGNFKIRKHPTGGVTIFPPPPVTKKWEHIQRPLVETPPKKRYRIYRWEATKSTSYIPSVGFDVLSPRVLWILEKCHSCVGSWDDFRRLGFQGGLFIKNGIP